MDPREPDYVTAPDPPEEPTIYDRIDDCLRMIERLPSVSEVRALERENERLKHALARLLAWVDGGTETVSSAKAEAEAALGDYLLF